MRIGLLGPLEVHAENGAELAVPGARLRTLLVLLALEPGRLIPATTLVEAIWTEQPPERGANALQALVSRLRRALPEIVIESRPNGYSLTIDPDAVDVARFERLITMARSAEDSTKARLLREALELWRGQVDMPAPQAARLMELRLTALEDRVEADLRLGRQTELIPELTTVVAENPLRERLVGMLMRALCAAGRSAEALVVYERARSALAEELGADPSPELSELHTAVLRGELGCTPQPETNLRASLTSFVGRDSEVTLITKLVGECRLVTLTGPGGAGKTRLAIETGRTLSQPGVWLIELAPVSADLPQAILATLGVREDDTSPTDRLKTWLADRNAVLILDNCEHVIADAAALADQLLGDCPRLRILATSREPLGITGEAVLSVEPLVLDAAVQLLHDRAHPGYQLDSRTAARICRALDGMPLAIELAAARLRTMTADQLANRLDDRFRLLTGGSRTALPRHRTLRAVIDWSWDLLTASERTVLRRLAIFARGATIEAVEQVCGPAEVLFSLSEKSLVQPGNRYQLLETIKQYALERLDEAGERDAIRRAHAEYFAELAETADPRLRRADQLIWLDRLAVEQDNIYAALRGAIDSADGDTAIRLVAAAGYHWLLDWSLRGRLSKCVELMAAALELPGPDDARATAFAIAALFNQFGNGDDRRGVEWLAKARELAARTSRHHPIVRLVTTSVTDSDPWVRAVALQFRTMQLINAGRGHAEAETSLRTALAVFEELGERWGIANTLTSLADLVAWRGDFAAAVAMYEQSIAVRTEAVPSEDAWQPRLRLAQYQWQSGSHAAAVATIAIAERDVRRIGLPEPMLAVAYSKADLARWSGDLATARSEMARALELSERVTANWQFRAMLADSLGYLEQSVQPRRDALKWALHSGATPVIAQVLVGVADLALHQGQPEKAAELLAAAEAIRGTADRSLPDIARVEAATRAALSDTDFAAATQRGQAATIAQVDALTKVILGPGTAAGPRG